VVGWLVLLLLSVSVWAQSSNDSAPRWAARTSAPDESDKANGPEEPPDKPKYILKHLAQDQLAIWTGPFKAKTSTLKWLVPVAGITTGLLITDRTASHEASRFTSFNSSRFSNVGLAADGASAAAFYLFGSFNGDTDLRETGALGGEAMLDALAVDEVLKLALQRQRPVEDSGAGRFFQRGSQQSFPSTHATLSFAFATVFAHEYDGWLSQTLAYGSASAVSLARVTGRQHFPSDIFVGGTLGYLIGRQVYRAHHISDVDSQDYGNFVREPTRVELNAAGSTFVELDSWIYPALDRLIGLNIIRRPFLGLRPWTRSAIAGMLSDARPLVEENSNQNSDVVALYSALTGEFSQEMGLIDEAGFNQNIRLESVYAGIYPIAGRPLNDSYHFGQTIINNFGRPYQRGLNAVSGFTARAESGHFFFYARGEYQRAPGAPAEPLSVRAIIATADRIPLQPANPVPLNNDFRLLDSYGGFAALGNAISIGKQSLWWGPGSGGTMIFSDNAEPMYMLRINRVLPLRIPLVSKLLGPLRYDNFFGKLSGHLFPSDPFMYGDKISFQPTENFEFGFSRTAVFAGEGHAPLTLGEFWHSFISANDVPASEKQSPRDPGARHGSFDFSYKVPFLRRWLTIYSDSIAHDEPNPVASPRRAAVLPGIYLSHVPGLNKLDFRAESGYTDIGAVHLPDQQGGHFIYWEQIYRDAYIHKANLMGSWIGRDTKGTQVLTNYWLGPASTIQIAFRNAKISSQFIPGGGTQNDFSAGARLRISKYVELLTHVQYERWNIPVLATNQNSDFLTLIQLTFWPKMFVTKKD
jgi:hypothetical protein